MIQVTEHIFRAYQLKAVGAFCDPLGSNEGKHTNFPLVSFFLNPANDSPMAGREPPIHSPSS